MEQNRLAPAGASAPEASTDEQTSPVLPPNPDLAFDPVPLRYRADGLTPDRQREYVEALADCGIARLAAARVGVSQQAVDRVRRRADAKSFNLACAAARHIGARKLHELAWERAIDGQVKKHFYHGEQCGEERVYDNRLLTYLLGKTEHLLGEPEEAAAIAADWEPWMEAVEQGLPAPMRPQPEPEPDEDEEPEVMVEEYTGCGVWEADGLWWTDFPPPAGFDSYEDGDYGDHDYRRNLTDAEQAVVDADVAAERAEAAAAGAVHRDRYFGFAGGLAEPDFSAPMEAETLTTSAPFAPDDMDPWGEAESPGWPDWAPSTPEVEEETIAGDKAPEPPGSPPAEPSPPEPGPTVTAAPRPAFEPRIRML